MAINDNDKKFIKDTIDNALFNYEKKSDDKLKKYEENRKKLSKQEREDYIAILQKKNEQGEATLAQKFEMLKLSVENAVPEDLKDAFSSGKKAVKGGLNQAGRGLEHITGRIMETNPLTALLWQNRDLIKAGLDIGVGGIRAVGGVAKGAALGAAGLFNQALNMRKKQQAGETEETEDDINISKFSPVFGASKENPVAEILEQKQDWQKQIDDIHKILIKQNKEQNVSNKTLSEGLGGLGKTMTTVKGFVDLIQSKQKLILAGVLVGVAALVGLAMWFQNGGMSKLFDSLFGPKNPGKINPTNFSNTMSNSINTTIMKQQDYAKFLGSNKQSFTGIKQTQKFSDRTINGYTQQIRQYDTGENTPILAPIDGTITGLKERTGKLNGGQTKTYFEFFLTGTTQHSSDSGLTQKQGTFKFENVLNHKVHNNLKVKKGQILGFSDGSFKITQMLGDQKVGAQILDTYQQLINTNKEQNWKPAIEATISNLTEEDYNQINRDTANLIKDKQFQQNATSAKTNGWMNVKNAWHNNRNTQNQEDIDAFLNDVVNGTQNWDGLEKQEQPQQEQPVATTVTPVSDNSQKAQQQTQTLKQQEVAADEKYNKQAQQELIESPAQTQSTISVDGDKTAYVFSDVQLSQAQYGAMTGNLMNLNIA